MWPIRGNPRRRCLLKPRIFSIIAASALIAAGLFAAPQSAGGVIKGRSADLSLIASVSSANQGFTTKFTVTNHGPQQAGAARLVAKFIGHVSAVRATSGNSSTVCATQGTQTAVRHVYACTVPQLAVGQVWRVTFAIKAPFNSSVVVAGDVTDNTPDPDTSNNSVAPFPVTAGPVADVEVIYDSQSAGINDSIAKLTIKNLGLNTSGPVSVLTTSGQFLMATSSCPEVNNPFFRDVSALAPGSSMDVLVEYAGIGHGGQQPTVEINSETGFFDPDTSNNQVVVPV